MHAIVVYEWMYGNTCRVAEEAATASTGTGKWSRIP